MLRGGIVMPVGKFMEILSRRIFSRDDLSREIGRPPAGTRGFVRADATG